MKKSKGIALKLSSLIIGLFLVLFIAYTLVTSVTLYNQSVHDAEETTLQNAELSAAKMGERFKKVNETLQTTKRIVETLHANGELSAEEILNILENNINSNNDLLGVGAVLENGTVQIEPTIMPSLVDQKNRFIPHLTRSENNMLISTIGDIDERSTKWYQIPKEKGRAVLTEPYEFNVDGNIFSMTTIAIPLVNASGTFFGVLTADLSIDFLKALVDSIKPEGGYASIITDQGVLTVNSINEELNGTNMQDAVDWTSIKQSMVNGVPVSLYVDSKQLGEQSFNALAPMLLDNIDEVWSVQLVLPKSEILKTYNKVLTFTIVAAIIMVILMAAASAMFIFKQLKPLKVLRASIETAAKGDLTKKIDGKFIKSDEIGAVASAYNNMLDKTNDAIHTVLNSATLLNQSSNDVHEAFNEIVASSQKVSVAINEIAQGASKQSKDTEETNYRMIDLSDQIDAITILSKQMDELSIKTKVSTEQGIKEVESLRDRNAETNDMNGRIQRQMESLSGSINNINQIIVSIQGITEQTNLLALNASIESARAGEHGKGFAVVAEEVRKLAEQSKNETEVIKNIVNSILEDAKQAGEVIASNGGLIQAQNESVQNTELAFKDNNELSNSITTAINELLSNIAKMSKQKDQAITAIQSIAAVSEEAASSAEQVNDFAVNQQAEIEKVAESVNNMNQISKELQAVVNRFKLAE